MGYKVNDIGSETFFRYLPPKNYKKTFAKKKFKRESIWHSKGAEFKLK